MSVCVTLNLVVLILQKVLGVVTNYYELVFLFYQYVNELTAQSRA